MSLKARLGRLEVRNPAPATAEGYFELSARGLPTGSYADRMSEAELNRALAMLEEEARARGLETLEAFRRIVEAGGLCHEQ